MDNFRRTELCVNLCPSILMENLLFVRKESNHQKANYPAFVNQQTNIQKQTQGSTRLICSNYYLPPKVIYKALYDLNVKVQVHTLSLFRLIFVTDGKR